MKENTLLEIWINTFFLLIVVGGITVIANSADMDRRLQPLLILIISGLNALLLLLPPLSYFASVGSDSPISTSDLAGAMLVSVVLMGICFAFLLESVRRFCARFFPQGSLALPAEDVLLQKILQAESRPSQPRIGFRPESMVHLWAFTLLIYFIAFQLITFFLAGGLSGVADEIGVSYGLLISGFLPQVLIPLLGVGWLMRRNGRETLERLGLRRPRWAGLGVAILSTIGLVFMVMIVSAVWIGIVGEETFTQQNQASDALAESINTLGLAFMVALTAGIGEELMFRGALQPIFGFWFTTISFVVAHIQYTLTPAALIILVVAIVFGLIRKYLDTTTAMLTHFLYNFTLLVLALASQEFLTEPSWLFALLR